LRTSTELRKWIDSFVFKSKLKGRGRERVAEGKVVQGKEG
jgi:hypothetical protein